jgi:hypothetical protein
MVGFDRKRSTLDREKIARLYAELDALVDDLLLEDMADAVKRARAALDVD